MMWQGREKEKKEKKFENNFLKFLLMENFLKNL